MKTQSIDATIFASSHPNIQKRISMSGLLFSGILLMAGLIILVSSYKVSKDADPITMSLLVLGTGLVVFSFVRFFSKSREIVYVPTGSVTREQSLFFDLKYLDELKQAVSTGNFALVDEVKSEAGGNIRMDIIISQDKKFAAVQLFQFVPYAYNPVTTIQYYTNGEATALAGFITGKAA